MKGWLKKHPKTIGCFIAFILVFIGVVLTFTTEAAGSYMGGVLWFILVISFIVWASDRDDWIKKVLAGYLLFNLGCIIIGLLIIGIVANMDWAVEKTTQCISTSERIVEIW